MGTNQDGGPVPFIYIYFDGWKRSRLVGANFTAEPIRSPSRSGADQARGLPLGGQIRPRGPPALGQVRPPESGRFDRFLSSFADRDRVVSQKDQ